MDKPMRDFVKDKIDPKIIVALLIVGIIEFEIFTIPREIVGVAGRDAWLSVLLGGVVLFAMIFLLLALAKRFQNLNFFQYAGDVWGKPIGWAIILAVFIYWLVFLVMALNEFSWINQILFLPTVPILIPKLLIALGAAALVSYGFVVMARFFQLMLIFIVVPFMGVFILTLPNINWENFFPLLEHGLLPVLEGIIYFLAIFQGMTGIILIFYPFFEKPAALLKPALFGMGLIFLLVLIETVGAIGVLGIENINESAWPGVDTITVIELPGFPVERFELWLTLPWIIGIFTTWSLTLYFLTYGIMQMFTLWPKKKAVIYATALVVCLLGYLIPNFTWIIKIREAFSLSTIGFVYMIPVLTLLVSLLRKKGGSGA